MARFLRAKPCRMLTVFLATSVLGTSLLSTARAVRLFEFHAAGTFSAIWDAGIIDDDDCLAVIPKIGRNATERTPSPLRIGSQRLFSLPAFWSVLTTFSKSRIAGIIQTCPDNIKNTILVRLRI
ncbi:MAG: hypothetical protein LBH50_04850 [Spirochaetaceae bacterium]|nr:hypothetical protein [Spirochaetaceae bacterium]